MNFLEKHQILFYFGFTFSISWGLILVLIAVNGLPATAAEAQEQLPFTILVFLGGPLISGLLMIALVDGKKGFSDVINRILKWRVNLSWYAIALLIAPLVFVTIHFLLSRISPVYKPGFFGPNGTSLVFLSIISGIMVGICEEIGWSGFAIPKLRQRYSIVKTGLVLGVVWGAWHIMANDIWAIRTYSGGLNPVLYAVLTGISFLIGQLPPYRFLMVWVYEKTGSLLVIMLMHFSLTACSIAFAPTSMAGWEVFIYSLSIAIAMWLLAGMVVLINYKEFFQR